ncbi:MAG: SRPBCC family protein [Polyangiaceae bacterium]
MWLSLRRSGLDFCAWSSERFTNRAKLACSADEAFELLSDTAQLPRWVHDCTGCQWTTSPPYGVGSTRDVVLKGGLTVHEEFLAWEPGERLTFTVTGMTIPLLRRMVEDFRLRRVSAATCELEWTVHYEPRTIAKLILPIARPRFVALFERSAQNLEKLVAGRG